MPFMVRQAHHERILIIPFTLSLSKGALNYVANLRNGILRTLDCSIILCYHFFVRNKHRRTLALIFRRPTEAGIRWADIESLLLACGAEIEERAGSRIGIRLKGIRVHAHRPHPRKEASKGLVEAIRDLLRQAGIEPC